MFNFKQDPAYDEKNIIKRRQNEVCMMHVCLLFCWGFFNQSFAEFISLAPANPGCFLLEYTLL